MYLILLSWSLHPLSINNWILYGYTNYYDSCCFFNFLCVCWFVLRLIFPVVCCLYIICLSLSVFRLCKALSVKMGGQLDKRMLHWQPATCCIFSCSLLSVIWRINYYYHYYVVHREPGSRLWRQQYEDVTSAPTEPAPTEPEKTSVRRHFIVYYH